MTMNTNAKYSTYQEAFESFLQAIELTEMSLNTYGLVNGFTPEIEAKLGTLRSTIKLGKHIQDNIDK